MAKFEYVHLCKFADQELPDALLDAVLKEHQSCAGVAIMGAVPNYLGTFLQSEGTNTKAVQELLQGHKDKQCFLSFGKGPAEYHEDNVQPFVALISDDNDGQTTMAAFLSGKGFDAKAKAGMDDSAALQVWKRLVLPQILKAAKLHEDDAEETYKEMASDPAIADLMSMFHNDQGAITIVCNEGTVTWGQFTQYEFGWATDPCGYVEKKAEPVKPAGKLGGPLSFGKAKPAPDGLAPAPKTETSQVSLQAGTTADTADDDEDFIWTSPPSAWSKDQKRKWYLTYNIINGKPVLPEGYKNCPKVKIKKALIEGKKPAEGPTTVKDFKDIDKDKIVTSSNTQVTTESLPVISPNSKKYLVDTFMKKGHVQKTISEGKIVIDPKRIEQLNSDWPSFVEAGGMEDIRQTLSFTHEDRMDLLKNAPDALVVLLQDTQLALYNTLKEHNQLDLKIVIEPEVKSVKKMSGLSFKK